MRGTTEYEVRLSTRYDNVRKIRQVQVHGTSLNAIRTSRTSYGVRDSSKGRSGKWSYKVVLVRDRTRSHGADKVSVGLYYGANFKWHMPL